MQFGSQPLEMAFAIMRVTETPRTVFVTLSALIQTSGLNSKAVF